jgi:hypothetical protein
MDFEQGRELADAEQQSAEYAARGDREGGR